MAIEDSNSMMDETYEFSAPRFFDFINGETEEEKQRAELWFETSLSHAPSPFMPRIKTSRSVQIDSLCDFSDVKHLSKVGGSSDSLTASCLSKDATLAPEVENSTRFPSENFPKETRKDDQTHQHKEENRISIVKEISIAKQSSEVKDGVCTQEKESVSNGSASIIIETGKTSEETGSAVASIIQGTEACTPNSQMIAKKGEPSSKKNQTAKKIASLVRNPTSALKPKNQLQNSQATTLPPTSARSARTAKKTGIVPDYVQENQAIKRQKLDEGRARQILNIKTQTLSHKSRLGLTGAATNLSSSTIKTSKEDRKVYVREAPFVSTAELVKRFQANTRDIGLPHNKSSLSHEDASSIIQRRRKLTLTRPKEPEFETAHRVRSIKIKSSAELEEEMMANIPKFKARPVNKKILEAPTLPALPRSTPHLPEFQEFHLKTMERANQHAETSSVVSATESYCQNQWNPHKLPTEPKTPRLETSMRARPPKFKSSQELEQEELKKIPKFKAKPLNKKIFESKGELGIFCNPKRHVTKPQEFHFATDDRIPPSRAVIDLFDKLSLNSEPHHDHQNPRITTPNPFHLHTEERGAEKERKFIVEVTHKQLEEERARIRKAAPYPYTTDYPVIPPKPEPKQCTKPEPFQLESLVRHEEEMQREMEERQRMEEEEAQMRIFKAQPILRDDPLPVPEKARKPLTQVEEFVLHVDNRAVDRAEFDQKVKEKEMIYKRYREEYESAKMMEEEKALKQMRRTMVPHARPVPNFENPFLPRKSRKETTKPKPPNLGVVRRKERRVTNWGGAASSAAAAHMR